MEYELLRDRHYTVTNSTPSMQLLHTYSLYRKDREEEAKEALKRRQQNRTVVGRKR